MRILKQEREGESLKEEYPEDFKDVLEAYPLRLNVNALPERRFVKMMRSLKVAVALLSSLMILLGVYLNYQITHLDVDVRKGKTLQFFRVDPESKQLSPAESGEMSLSALRLVAEDQLMKYLKMRNRTVWNQDEMIKNWGVNGLIYRMSSDVVYRGFEEERNVLNNVRGLEMLREVHVYELKWVRDNLWMAIIETFDMPLTDTGFEVCECSDNTPACIDCHIAKTKKRERRKIWMRTGFSRKPPEVSDAFPAQIFDLNPMGVSVEKYVSVYMPINEKEPYWDLPPALRPDI